MFSLVGANLITNALQPYPIGNTPVIENVPAYTASSTFAPSEMCNLIIETFRIVKNKFGNVKIYLADKTVYESKKGELTFKCLQFKKEGEVYINDLCIIELKKMDHTDLIRPVVIGCEYGNYAQFNLIATNSRKDFRSKRFYHNLVRVRTRPASSLEPCKAATDSDVLCHLVGGNKKIADGDSGKYQMIKI